MTTSNILNLCMAVIMNIQCGACPHCGKISDKDGGVAISRFAGVS